MKLTKNEWLFGAGSLIRPGLALGLCLMGMVLGRVANAQAVSTTTVQGTVYLANGQAGVGTLDVSWPAFTTANNQAITAGRTTVTIAPNGFIAVNLAPNLGSTPAGLYYTVVYHMSDGTTSTEYWVVPTAAQASLGQVRAQLMPAAQAVQAVSKAYVDQSIAELTQSLLTASGGTLNGPLFLNGDPTQALQAADKHYVDSTFNMELPIAGGSMTGPLTDSSGFVGPMTGNVTGNVSGTAMNVTGVVQLGQGGTGASTATGALTNLGGLPLAGGTLTGALTGPNITATQLGGSYQVDQFSGANFGARLQACLGTLNTTYGGTCDARNFTGTQSMGSSLTISIANATVLLPCATISTANQIIVTAGTRNVSLRGCALRGASTASGSQGGTVFLYSGASAMVQVGDPTYAADTSGFHLDNVVINTTAANSATAQGLAAYRTQEMDLESLYFLGNQNQTGMTLDGTGNYTGGTFFDNNFNGFQTAVNAIGHQISNPATTDWLNASTFVRLHIDCPTSGGSPIAGTYGINLLQGDGNTFTGGDVEGCSTALHLGPNAQNNTIVGLRNENSTNQVVADVGSAYNNWMTGGTMFTGQLTDNGTRNSFLDTFHRSFNGLNGDWYGSQKDATVINHFRVGIGVGNERGLQERYQTDYGYRWTTGLSDATAGEQFYQVLDELNNVYRLSIGQYNNGQSGTNNQTVINAAGTGAIVLNGSNNSGTGGVVFGSGGASESTVATINNAGNAQFNGTLLVGGTAQSTGTMTVRNNADAEVDYYIWPGLTTSQKGSYTYKDWNGNSQWYMVKDASNNWALNSATGGLDSFKAYQSTNSGDTYINASNSSGVVRVNYETGSGTAFNIYGGGINTLYASFTAANAIKFPGLAASSGHNCLQIDNLGYITNDGAPCGTGSGSSGTVNSGASGQIAYYTASGTAVGGMNTVPLTAGGTGAATAASALASLGGLPLAGGTMTGALTATQFNGPLAGNASTATALAATPAQCSSGQYATGVTASGGANCTQVAYSQLSGTVPTWNQSTTGTSSNVTGTIGLSNGGTGATTAGGAFNNIVAPGGTMTGALTAPQFNGPLSGNVTGNVTGNLTGNVTGTSSNVTGTVQLGNGGTGATTAAGAIANLLPGVTTNGANGIGVTGNAQFNGTLLVGGTAQSTGTMTVRNNADAEADYYLWPGLTTSQKGSYTYKDWNGNSQWYMVKDASNNWALNSATGGLDSFKAYQSTNSGDTYINASNSSGVVRVNYETGSGAGFNIYGGSSNALYASFTGTTAIKFPGLAASSGHNCLQIDNSGYITNTGSACGTGSGGGSGTVNSGASGQIAYYTASGTAVGGMNTIPLTAGGTGAATASGALANLGGVPLNGTGATGAWGISITGNAATATNVAYSGLTGTAPTWNQSTTGNAATATALTGGLASLGIGFVSVKKCGSTGDGSTDDTAAILSCIEYANTNKLNLYVPAGIYKFTSSLNMCAVVGNPTASCTFPWGLEVWGEGRFVSILAPNLSSPGPALDFGGATNAGIHHIGIVDPSGDQATVGVLSTHGGMSGAVGDVFTSDDVNIGMSGSTAFGMIVLGADLSGIANTQISAGCSALVIGDGLGTASAVTSPFYTIGNSNNGFSLANIGTANSANTFTSYNCPAMQLTGSGSYNFSGINYAVVDGTPAGANLTGVITVTGGEGNNLYGGTIRTENNAHTGVTPIPLPAFYLGTGVAIHSINLNLDLGLNAGDYAFAGSSSASINNGTINCGVCAATAGFFNLPSTSAYTVSRVTAYIGTGSGGLGTVGRFNGNTVYWFGGAKSSILAQLPSGASSDLICANDGCINTDLTISGNVNGLALVAAASGFTMAGGTISKTLTVGANINTGSTDGTLGSAAFTASTAYDASGAAATAQSNAETYASNASNLSTGTLSHALLPALQSADIPNNTANTSGTAATATSATNFSGSLAGDVTGTQGSTSVVKVNGAAVPVSKTVVGTNASGQIVDASSAVLPTVVTNPGDLLCAQAGDTTIGAASITAGSSTPSAMTYTINFSSIVPGWFYVGQIVSSQGNTPSGYNGAPLTVTAVSPSSATVTVSSTNNPATLTSGGTLSLYCSNQATDAAQTGWYNLGGQTAFSTIYTIPGNTIKAGYTLNLKPQLLTFSPSSGQSNGKMAYSLYYGASPLWFIDSNASGGSGIQLSQSYVPGGQGATTNFDFSLVGLSTTLFVTSQSSAAYPSNASNLGGVLAGYSTVNGYAISPNFLVTTSNQNVALKVAWWPGSLKSGTYTSGITATGSTGQTCSLSSFNNVTGATATVALTGTNTIASGTALVVTAGGTNASGASTTATAANGTATCSGTATVSTTMGGTPGYAALLIDWVGRN